jgi:hypothetical protein
MKATVLLKRTALVAEAIVVTIMTISLLSTLLLYITDLLSDSPVQSDWWGVILMFMFMIGILSILFAIVTPDSMYQRNLKICLALVVILIIAFILLVTFAIMMLSGDLNFGILIVVAVAVTIIHQVFRFLRILKSE